MCTYKHQCEVWIGLNSSDKWSLRVFIEMSTYLPPFKPFDFKYIICFEFSLNDFPWIQWIMTKSKGSMVTRGIIHLATDT